MPLKGGSLTTYLNKYFVETGTFHGFGVFEALETGFSEIYTIEIDEKMYKENKELLEIYPNVHTYLGDSAKVLPELLKEKINAPATFWLDAHFSGDGTGMGEKLCPVEEELNAIIENINETKNFHTIMIDDISFMRGERNDSISGDVEKYSVVSGYIPIDLIIAKIRDKICHEYRITILDSSTRQNDVFVAVPKK